MAEIDDLVEAAGGAPAQRAQSAIIAGMDKDPEAASRAYGISAEIGVPPQTVYEDLKGFEQEERNGRRGSNLNRRRPSRTSSPAIPTLRRSLPMT